MIDISVHQKKLDYLNKWLILQINFREQRRIGFERGYEFMGDLSQFWGFETWYAVEVGQIRMIA
jgi:hypothetical protein